MSTSGADIPSRPSSRNLWSYFSNFSTSRSPSRHARRRSSVPLPTRETHHPYENGKPNGHYSTSATQSFMHEAKVAWMNQGQRTRYIKALGLLTFICLIFFFLAPGEREKVEHYVGDHFPSTHKGSSSSPSDPLLTTEKCSKPHSAHKPLIQYALMVDAGSTGSRIHVYRFNNCGPTPELEDEIFEQTAKKQGGSGLSSYKADAEGAAKSLDPLLAVAMENVPDSIKSCTPIAVKATAGLRKLGPEMSKNILDAVRHRLETAYPFPVVAADKGGVEVMDGKDEGVYAWITTNYLLGKIGGPEDTPTAAVFDLGGGSTQIVFQPRFPVPNERLADGDHKYDLTFGGRHFTLYQHSYLGYGLMAARENLHKTLVSGLHSEHGDDSTQWINEPVTNPCIAPGMHRTVTVELGAEHPLGDSVKVNMTGPSTASPAQCRALAEKTLAKEKSCTLSPCAFDGVHQPRLDRTFAHEDIYLFSYFYDRMAPLGMPESFTLRELHDLTHKVCAGEESGQWDVFEEARDELRKRPEWCLDLSFMYALLRTGYEMPIEREVKIAKKIRGNELGWCLGASLPLLAADSGWQCKIKEVSK